MTTILDEISTLWEYDDLKSKVASWIHRGDLTAQIPDFIVLAEDEINTEMRLRLMEVDETLTLASGERTVALPARYLEPIKLDIVIAGQDNRQLTYLSPKQMVVNASAGAACEPDYWTISGENIEFPGLANQDYALTFRMLKGFDIATTFTNVLLDKYRGIYLYGALVQASLFMVDDKRVPTWGAMYAKLKANLLKHEARSKVLTQLRSDHPSACGARSNILRG